MAELQIYMKSSFQYKLNNNTLKYLDFILEFSNSSPTDYYEKNCISKTFTKKKIEKSIIAKLAILHPQNFEKHLGKPISKDKITQLQKEIQGPRSFMTQRNNRNMNQCQSLDMWGYECPFPESDKALDHEFPYSLGGPTNNAFNMRILCKWHNMIKANDIHNYPWEKLFDEYNYYSKNDMRHWIDEQIDKIQHELNTKFY